MKYFFDPDDWKSFFGQNILRDRVLEFPETILNTDCPFNLGKKKEETHFVFLGLSILNGRPLNLLALDEVVSRKIGFLSSFIHPKDKWLLESRFAREVLLGFRWYCMLIDVPIQSLYQTHMQQVEILPPGYRMALVIEEVMKDVLFFMKYGKRPNHDYWARCKEFTGTSGDHLGVGFFDTKGVNINQNLKGSERRRDVGISAVFQW